MKKLALIFICLISFSYAAAAKEVGDLMYQKGGPDLFGGALDLTYSMMWGWSDVYAAMKYPGHTMIYLGADENGDEWVIEAGPIIPLMPMQA